MFCAMCGKKIIDGAKFCHFCGAPTNEKNYKQAVETPELNADTAAPVPAAAPIPIPAQEPDPIPAAAPVQEPVPAAEQPAAPDERVWVNVEQEPLITPAAAPIPIPAQEPEPKPEAVPAQEPAPTLVQEPAPTPAAPIVCESDKIVPAGKKIRHKCTCGSVVDTTPGALCSKCGRPQDPNSGYYKLYRMGNFIGMAAPFSIYIDGQPYGHIGNKQTCWIKLPYGQHLIHIAAGFNRKCTDMTFTLSPEHPLECATVHIRVGAVTNTYVIEPAENDQVPD